NQVVGAIKRVPANVVGDGQHTIEQLIKQKNETRKENPYLKTKLIEADSELISYIERSGYNLKSVPDIDKIIYLRGAANISAGGDPVESLNDLSDKVKQTAIEALKAIPGLKHAGVDILANEDESFVLEVNTTADICMHVFPQEGQSINVPEAIIDCYFPETKGKGIGNEKLYFGYKEIHELFTRNVVQEFHLTDASPTPLYAKRYVVSGKVQKVAYRNWIRKEANKRSLSG